MAQEMVSAPGHASTASEHVTELKVVFDGILQHLAQIDARLRKTPPTERGGQLEKRAMAEEMVSAPGHASSACEHVTELKTVFDGILKYLVQTDTSLRKTSHNNGTEGQLDKMEFDGKQLEEPSHTEEIGGRVYTTAVDEIQSGEPSKTQEKTDVDAELLKEFLDAAKVWDTEKMMSMIDKQPHLMLKTSTWAPAWASSSYGELNPLETVCSVFHLAVLLNCDKLVDKMLGAAVGKDGKYPPQLLNPIKFKFKINYKDGKYPPQLLDPIKFKLKFNYDSDNFEMSPLDIAGVRGNQYIRTLLKKVDEGCSENDLEALRISLTREKEESRGNSLLLEEFQLEEKHDILDRLGSVLNSNVEAFFQGEIFFKSDHHSFQKRVEKKRSKKQPSAAAQRKSELLKGTVREMLLQQLGNERAVWWGAQYGISLGEEDDLFILHCFATLDRIDPDSRFASDRSDRHSAPLKVLEEICKALGRTKITRLLNLMDHNGQTPLHVWSSCRQYVDDRVDYDYRVMMCIMKEYCDGGHHIFKARDLAGRTCLHIAAAVGNAYKIKTMAVIDFNGLRDILDDDGESEIFGRTTRTETPLNLAVLHGSRDCVQTLMSLGCDANKRSKKCVDLKKTGRYRGRREYQPVGGALQLAASLDRVLLLKPLLSEDELWDRGMMNPPKYEESSLRDYEIPALHLAALCGSTPEALSILLDSGKFDPFAVDDYGDTALHFLAAAELVPPELNVNDFVDVYSFYRKKPSKHREDRSLSVIEGCMELLMQCRDLQNKDGETPQLKSSAPFELARWWNDKLATQFQEDKTHFVTAATAVSVTAPLVATASYVGPLQPPLGLSTSPEEWLNGYSQVNHTAVQVFLFCNSLSFYLAIASIMLAVIPVLTIPREGLSLQVRIAHKVMEAAAIFLFASITFVVCAFGAANIAILPESRWHDKVVVVFATILGSFICLVVLNLFLLRLMRLFLPKAKWVARLTDALFPSKPLKTLKKPDTKF